jgi:hypothetical protein
MTDEDRTDDALFERLAAAGEPDLRAPSKLKARIFSALMREATRERRLLPLAASEAAGGRLCVFERFVHGLPLPSAMDRLNCCRFCHPRWMAETMDHAPVFWKGCPYAAFQRH